MADHGLFLEDQFRQFRQVASEFTRGIATRADFRTDGDGTAAARVNLALVRSVFGKWSIDILVLFHTDTRLGFGELKRALPRISSRVLSSKLKKLEALGLLRREVLATRPPRVQYALTERGLTLTELGEPVLLFLRVSQGLYADRAAPYAISGGRRTDSPGRRP
jgi:DNA-binding HxlR family transcriptional regulator